MPSPTIRKMEGWAEGRLPTDPGLCSGCGQEDVLLSTRTESASGELMMGLSVSVWIGLGSSPLAVHCPLGRTARELADTIGHKRHNERTAVPRTLARLKDGRGQHVPRRPGGLRPDGEATSGRRHRAGRSTLYSRRARGRPARSRSLVVTP